MKIKLTIKIILILLTLISFANNTKAENSTLERHDFITYPLPMKSPTSLFENNESQLNTLGKFQGKVTILKFVNSSCSSCLPEISKLSDIIESSRIANIAIVAVFPTKEDMSSISSLHEKYKLKAFSQFRDIDGLTFRSFGVIKVPRSFIINQQGKLVAYASNFVDWNKQANINFLRQLLQKTT